MDRGGQAAIARNAFRHGLTAETVIEIIEDIEDYQAFEAPIIADYDAHTAVERELVLRLASLLWRICRATSIETDLLRIQAEILRDHQNAREPAAEQPPQNSVYRFLKAAIRPTLAIIRETVPTMITVRLLAIIRRARCFFTDIDQLTAWADALFHASRQPR